MDVVDPSNDNNAANDWAAWFNPNENEMRDENEGQTQNEEMVQQQEIPFDQSGSTAQYLRAHGPDIVLNVADVLAGTYGSSSTSSDEVSSSFIGPLQLPTNLQIVEGRAFQMINDHAATYAVSPCD